MPRNALYGLSASSIAVLSLVLRRVAVRDPPFVAEAMT